MERLTTRNEMGIAVLRTPYSCDRCGEETYRLGDYGTGEPIEKLAAYEEAEEQGKLLKLPCAVGDTVYIIDDIENEFERISVVTEIEIEDVNEVYIMISDGFQSGASSSFRIADFGKTVFLTQEEAETALKEGQEGVK